MTSFAISLLIMSLTGGQAGDAKPLGAPSSSSEAGDSGILPAGVQLAQMTIEQRVIIRVPMVHRAVPPPPAPSPRAELDDRRRVGGVDWVERDGPKCIKIGRVVGAAVTSDNGVDLMLRDKNRIRARFGRGCRADDLYSGFYIQPHDDGALCAGRDRILARSGADCEIVKLKRLVPER